MDFQPDYNNQRQKPVQEQGSSSMCFASIAFGIISLLTCCMGTSLLFGSLGMILALLARGRSNAYPKNAVIGMALNIIGMAFGVLLIISAIIAIVTYGSIDNFMNAMQDYMNAYYSAYGNI